MDIVYPADPARTPTGGSRNASEEYQNVHPIGAMDYLAWVYLLDMAYLILADEDIRVEAAALGKPVLLLQGSDISDADTAANPNVVKAGSGRLEIVARISSLLNGSRAYDAMRQASSQPAGSDSYRPMLEALANLCSAPMAPADRAPGVDLPVDAGMQGVRGAL
jgi:UDP-N-acetylglucosamine 2-epimerase